MRCQVCGLLFVAGSDAASLDASQTYADYHAHSEFAAPTGVAASLTQLVSSAASYRSTNCWLDVGFGEGDLLAAAEREGWDCFGTEVSPHALDHGRARGWTVASEPLGDPRFLPAACDVVTMIEVLEHLADPRGLLDRVAASLRPGGLLYLTTPNARSLNRWVLGAEWSVLCPPEHLALWTARGISALLRDAGFGRTTIRTEGFNPVEIVARLRSDADSRKVHRLEAGVALSRALSRSGPRRAFKTIANLVLNLLGIGDTLKVRSNKGKD